MAGPPAVQVQGFEELIIALRTLQVTGRLDREMLDAGKRWLDRSLIRRMAARAPRRSGRLAGSVRSMRSAKAVGLAVGTEARVPYAGPINFGWRRRNIRAQEFIYSTIAREGKEWEESFVHHLDRWLSTAFPEGKL